MSHPDARRIVPSTRNPGLIPVPEANGFSGGDVHDLEPGPVEDLAGRRPNLPVAPEEPLSLDQWQEHEAPPVARVGPLHGGVVLERAGDEGKGLRVALWEPGEEDLPRVAPYNLVALPDDPADDAGPLGDRQALGADPPRQEPIQPTPYRVVLWDRVTGPAQVRSDAADGAVAREEIPEHLLLELLQLVEPQKPDRGSLPGEAVLGVLEMGELHRSEE